MTPDKIGFARGIVRVVPYDPNWAECFREEKDLLLKTVGEKIVAIRHIGSTSILGMPAKPIIDILVAVKTLADVEHFTEALMSIGYDDKRDGGVLGRRYFVKGEQENRTHHLNFCEINSLFWRSHLRFRDYLELHPDAAQQYSTLKRDLAEKFPNSRSAYTNGKEDFVHYILNLAMKEGRT